MAEVALDIRGSIMRNKHDYAGIQHTSHPPVYVWAWHRQGRFGIEEGRHRLCRQAHFCEVEVDTETGEVEVKRVINVNDVGKALSPEGVEGQQYGGTFMGIGRNRCEEYIWDEKTGVLLNGNLCDYKFATMNDIGASTRVIVETGMGYGPYGSVGVGEVVATVTTYLLEGAVYNAIGEMGGRRARDARQGAGGVGKGLEDKRMLRWSDTHDRRRKGIRRRGIVRQHGL